jgi:hypothetical protein
LSVDFETVDDPSQRSDSAIAPVCGSSEISESPPPGKFAFSPAGRSCQLAPPSSERNTSLGEPGRFDSSPVGALT